MSDVSITDLIARLRYQYNSSNPLAGANASVVMSAAADSLEAAERDAQQAEDQANNLAGDVVQLEQKLAALEAITVPTEKPPVHNHGTEEGRGLACPESVVGGFLRGACVLAAEQTHPFSQSPHMAAKYWAELVRARNRIAELEAAAVPVAPDDVTEGGTQ